MLRIKASKVVVGVVIGLISTVSAYSQTFSVLYAFQGGNDGSGPGPGLAYSGGFVYGTTAAGGGPFCYKNLGCGVIFKVNVSSGAEKVLYAFKGTPDGAGAYGGVLKVGRTLYGNTNGGGAFGTGAVYKWTSTGEKVLTSLHGAGGAYPSGPMARDAAGNLYGTAGQGGIVTGICASSGCGTVYKIRPTGREIVLHKFKGYPSDGTAPTGLIRDAAGNLYGVTWFGGGTACNGQGCGTVFEITNAGQYKVLYNFAGGASDGWVPKGLLLDSVNKILYGTTEEGGAGQRGTVFSLDLSTGKEAVLWSFGGAGDGVYPTGPLVFDTTGNLWGTTANGGVNGFGTIFELQVSGGVWTEALLFSFLGGVQGSIPAGLVYDKVTGNFYGNLSHAGPITGNCPNGCGTVFKFHP